MRNNPVAARERRDLFRRGSWICGLFLSFDYISRRWQFLSLYLPSLDTQMWSGSANLFKVCAVTTLLLTVYLGSTRRQPGIRSLEVQADQALDARRRAGESRR